jgi:hypothetical protein
MIIPVVTDMLCSYMWGYFNVGRIRVNILWGLAGLTHQDTLKQHIGWRSQFSPWIKWVLVLHKLLLLQPTTYQSNSHIILDRIRQTDFTLRLIFTQHRDPVLRYDGYSLAILVRITQL